MLILRRRRRRPALFGALALLLQAVLGAAVWAAEPPDRIVAIGDLHGDYGAFEEVMVRAGLMDAETSWVGGETVLVQQGDIAGRGPDTLKIIRALKQLQNEAEAAGGKVIVLVGNHEAMQMTGDLRYVHAGEWASFARKDEDGLYTRFVDKNQRALARLLAPEGEQKATAAARYAEMEVRFKDAFPPGYAGHRMAWSPRGEIGAWVLENPAAVILADTLFVHGGLSASFAEHTVDEINAETRQALINQTRDRSSIIWSPYGPQWYRGLNREPGDSVPHPHEKTLTVEEEVSLLLKHFDVERIVIGHTPSLEGIKSMHQARVIQIDTGMSSYYGGTRSFLEITAEGMFANDNGVVREISTPAKDEDASFNLD